MELLTVKIDEEIVNARKILVSSSGKILEDQKELSFRIRWNLTLCEERKNRPQRKRDLEYQNQREKTIYLCEGKKPNTFKLIKTKKDT